MAARVSPPNTSALHNSIKFLNTNTSSNAHAAVRLENHILEEFLIHILLQHSRHAPQVRQRDRTVLPVREQPECLLDLGAVRIRVVLSAVELEGADGEEGLERSVTVVFGVEN
ncbi:hypothetical protein HG530_007360 [Fusarium avenaceum]|nr:hypothetical protein HG530_007360 [Fusarium avenaceum]